MPIVIGAKPESNFNDPIGLLTDCHRRIEMFLGVLTQLAEEGRGGELTDEQRVSLAKALKYFREAAPKHTADEEETLFPRLRACEDPGVLAILDRVDSLENDHRRAEQDHAEIDRLGHAWLRAGSLEHEDVGRLAGLLRELSGLYRDHIALEERDVFPAAAKALDDSARSDIGAEMAARRRP
jgi:hemerythrin-like domain-containing protein